MCYQMRGRLCLRCDLRLLLSKPILPPKKRLWVEFTKENVALVPEAEGVYQLLDEQESVIYIKGAMNLRSEIEEQLELSENARYFMYDGSRCIPRGKASSFSNISPNTGRCLKEIGSWMISFNPF